MKSRFCCILFLLLFLILIPRANAIVPVQKELDSAKSWYEKSFFPEKKTLPEPKPGVAILACPFKIYRNADRYGSISIGSKKYTSGLTTHANCLLRVDLPSPGIRFTAMAGIVKNLDTAYGGGSVIFSVRTDQKILFQSEIKRGGEEGTPVNVDLNKSRSFLLAVSDANDNFFCDQGCWANAKILLENGSSILLSDLPIVDETKKTTYDYPFSFVYKGESSRSFLKKWKTEIQQNELDANRTEFTILFSESNGPLRVKCIGIVYKDFPTVEWTLYFKNSGKVKSPILENIRAVDTTCCGPPESVLLRHWIGGRCTNDGFLLKEHRFSGLDDQVQIKTSNGRGSDDAWPYFNLESKAKGVGLIVAVGWPGQWNSDFAGDNSGKLRFSAGQEDCHFSLEPNEEIRSPLSVIQFWHRNTWMDGQNVWRQWMLKYNVPRVNGQLETHHINGSSSPYYETMAKADEASQKMFIDRYLEEKIPLDYWWMDAGWYPCRSWPETGTWEVDRSRFPKGLRAVTDYAHKKGVKSIVWFEPESVAKGTWLDKNRPEWILGTLGEFRRFLNWGHSEALKWTIEHFDNIIKSEGIDFYRQDHNIPGLRFWRAVDSPDRKGISEIKHVTGYLKFWDELIKRNPNLRIDSCSAGGRRNDLETMRRSVPLLRSDFNLETTSSQVQTQGITLWLPLYGVTLNKLDDYSFRSIMTPYLHFTTDLRDRKLDYNSMRKNIEIWKKYLVPLYTKDFYILTKPTLENELISAWQFNDPESGKGVLQVFRRQDSPYSAIDLKLYGLERKAKYRFKNVDSGTQTILTGETVISDGLFVHLKSKKNAAIIAYEKL